MAERYATESDGELIRLIAGADQDALSELYDRYHRRIYAFSLRMLSSEPDAEEIVSGTFLRAWRSAGGYEAARAEVSTWLLSITRNLCIDELRRRRRRAAEAGPLEDAPEPVADDRTDLEVEQAMMGAKVREALQRLPGEQRAAIELVYFSGMTSQEVGEVLHVPAPTVRSRLRLGLLKLADALRAEGVTSL